MIQKLTYRFSIEKNALLKAERGIGFDDVIYAIENGDLLDTIRPKAAQYRHQQMFVVEVNGYAYAVPFIEKGAELFLITIYADRRLTKQYLGEER